HRLCLRPDQLNSECPEVLRAPRGIRVCGDYRSNSPSFVPPTKASHSFAVNRRIGPLGSLESRTARPPSGSSATSTQLPPLLDRLDLRQRSSVMTLPFSPLTRLVVLI